MAALTEIQAQDLALNALVPGAVETARQMHFVAFGTPSVSAPGYAPELARVTQGDMSSAGFVAEAGTPLENSAVPSPVVSFPFARIASVVSVDRLVDAVYSWPTNQVEFQIKAKIIGTIVAYSDAVINGGTTWHTPYVNGIKAMIPPGQTVGADGNAVNGGHIKLMDMADAYNLVKTSDGCGPHAILMNRDTIRSYAKACNDAGMAPELITREECHERIGRFCGAGSAGICEMVCPPVALAYNKTPIREECAILLDETKGTGTNLTSIYFVTFGVRGLNAIVPEKQRGIFEVGRVSYGNYDTDGWIVAMNFALMNFALTEMARIDGVNVNYMHP